MRCARCHRRHESFDALRLIGYMAGFDEADRPVLLESRNCDGCEATYSRAVSRARVVIATNDIGKIGASARAALEDLEFHMREGT